MRIAHSQHALGMSTLIFVFLDMRILTQFYKKTTGNCES